MQLLTIEGDSWALSWATTVIRVAHLMAIHRPSVRAGEYKVHHTLPDQGRQDLHSNAFAPRSLGHLQFRLFIWTVPAGEKSRGSPLDR